MYAGWKGSALLSDKHVCIELKTCFCATRHVRMYVVLVFVHILIEINSHFIKKNNPKEAVPVKAQTCISGNPDQL